ncbi:MAG: GH25 family lysozyme [Pseudomonadota bacterium]
MAASPDTYSVRGIDVSHYQGEVNWADVARDGIQFAFIKATDGASIVDPNFRTNWANARSAGILCGAYHFLRPNTDGKEQGEHFASLVGPSRGSLPPALDIEVTEGVEPQAVEQAIIDWIGAVKKTTDVRPVLYTSPAFWTDHVGADFQSYPLWLACYDKEPKMPAHWPQWTFWQHSQSGRVAGVSGQVDLNVFRSTFADLKALCIGSNGAPLV